MKGSLLYQIKGGVLNGSPLPETVAIHTSLTSFFFPEDEMFSANDTFKTRAHMFIGSVGVRQ